jgi:hypothetical protein
MLMAALSFKARAVIQHGLEGIRPAAGERARLEALLHARLGSASPSLVARAPLPLRFGGWRLATSFGLGAALVAGSMLLMRGTKSQLAAAPLTEPAATVAFTDGIEAADLAADLPSQAASEPVFDAQSPIGPPAPTARPQNRLAQEVALISRATSELRAGRAKAATKLLDEHRRKFPSGALGVERRAVSAQALCALKRVSEGRAELAQLDPRSPAAGRAKQVCDAASGSVR